MTIELKPCPFCGGEAAIDSFKHGSGVAVVCAGGCGLDTVGYWSDSHVSIAERWNRRADLVDPAAIRAAALEAAAAYVSQNSLQWRFSCSWSGKDFAEEILALIDKETEA